MAHISKEDVLKLAQLARLDLTDEEVEEFGPQLTAILDYVEILGKADVKGLKPTQQITGLTNVTRRDEIIDYGYQAKDLLKNVPKVKDDQIEVKRMIG